MQSYLTCAEKNPPSREKELILRCKAMNTIKSLTFICLLLSKLQVYLPVLTLFIQYSKENHAQMSIGKQAK